MSNNEAVTGETSIINEEHAARAAIAEAVARRAANASHDDDEERRFAMERDKRQLFRRLVDPGIARHTQPVVFEAAVKMLSTIADNLLKDPEMEKYRRFKPTNSLIKKHLVEVKGAIEYAVEMGFRAEVVNFQPYYTFLATPKNWDNLRIGAAVLKETLDRIREKEEQARLNRVDPKAVQREIAQKVKMAYEDDRKEKKRRDELERQAREARTAVPTTSRNARSSASPRHVNIAGPPDDEDYDETLMSPLPHSRMPRTGGHTLREDPPPYNQPEQPETETN